MTEFDRDVQQRKQLAQQSRYRKNGSRSKKCTLPQDTMTNAQLKKKNGEVISFNMNMPIYSWKDFKALSKSTATEYITGLDAEFDPSMNDLAKMFGVTYNTVRDHLKEIGCPLPKGTMHPSKKESWEKFLGPIETKPAPKKKEKPKEKTKEEPAPVDKSAMRLREFALEFDGEIDLKDIINSLKLMIGEEQRAGVLKIQFSASDEQEEPKPYRVFSGD